MKLNDYLNFGGKKMITDLDMTNCNITDSRDITYKEWMKQPVKEGVVEVLDFSWMAELPGVGGETTDGAEGWWPIIKPEEEEE